VAVKKVEETKLVSEIKPVQVELKNKVEAPVAVKPEKLKPTTT
jgi:hypothetical protein